MYIALYIIYLVMRYGKQQNNVLFKYDQKYLYTSNKLTNGGLCGDGGMRGDDAICLDVKAAAGLICQSRD